MVVMDGRDITLKSKNMVSISTNSAFEKGSGYSYIHVPADLKEAYEADENWKTYIDEGIVTIVGDI